MTWDYIAFLGSSAAPKKTFSEASDFCPASHSLTPINIEIAVWTHMRIFEGVPLGPEFRSFVDSIRADDDL